MLRLLGSLEPYDVTNETLNSEAQSSKQNHWPTEVFFELVATDPEML